MASGPARLHRSDFGILLTMAPRIVVGALALSSAPIASAFALQPLGRAAVRTHGATPLRPSRLCAPLASAEHPFSLMRAARAPAPRRPVAARLAPASRFASSLLVSLFALLLPFAGRAYAISRSASRGGGMTGSIIKWGGLGAIMTAAYVFRSEETPILTETAGVDPEAARAAAAEAADFMGAEAVVSTTSRATAEASASEDDGMLFSSLQERMAELASGAEKDEGPGTPEGGISDSTDSWGEGNTAVLEPPRDDDAPPRGDGGSLLDGPPAVDFPAGYPLKGFNDGEVSEADFTPQPEPTLASDEDVEMLRRMFGGEPPSA